MRHGASLLQETMITAWFVLTLAVPVYWLGWTWRHRRRGIAYLERSAGPASFVLGMLSCISVAWSGWTAVAWGLLLIGLSALIEPKYNDEEPAARLRDRRP